MPFSSGTVVLQAFPTSYATSTLVRNVSAMSIDDEDDDDLGAFFEEVSAAEEEAKKEVTDEKSNHVGGIQETIVPHYLKSTEGHDASAITTAEEISPMLVPSGMAVVETKPISAVVIKREAIITRRRMEPTISTTSLDSTAALTTPFPPLPPPLPSDNLTATSSGSVPYRHPYSYSSTVATNNPTLGPIPQPQGVASAHGTYPLLGGQPPETAPQSQSKKGVKRIAAGKVWEDPSLAEWPANDFRLFVGNLAKDVKNEQLFQHFHSKYPSVALARIVLDKNKNSISKGYGFVSFLDPLEAARAIREMNETFLGSRPIKVKKSDWKERDLNTVKKKKHKNHIN